MAEPPQTILYLDHSEVQLAGVSEALRARGHRVRSARTVDEAARQLEGVDLILIDYHMPEMTGQEALRRLRPHTQRHQRVVGYYLYTSDRDVAVRYKEMGFDGAFTCKGDFQELQDQVGNAARVLRLRRYREQRKQDISGTS